MVIEVMGSSAQVAGDLAAGRPVDEVLNKLWSAQKAETKIPPARIQSLRWIEGYRGLTIHYQDERGRDRRKTTYIAEDAAREKLIEQIEAAAGHRFHRRHQPAGFWKLAWSQMLGALLSIVGTCFLLAFWDPQMVARARGGWIALKLGPNGCAFVGFCFLIGCLIAAWYRVHPRPIEHQCTL